MATLSDVRVEGKLMRVCQNLLRFFPLYSDSFQLELVVDATRSQEPVKKLSDRVT